MDNIKNIIQQNSYNPIIIGIEILKQAGYKVDITGYGYNSLSITVYDKDDNKVYSTTIGD